MKDLWINGINVTSLGTPAGYNVTHKKVQGGNEGVMRDGSYVEDVIAYKAVFTFPFMPLTEEELERVQELLYQYEYPTVWFYDPKAKGYVSRQCKFEVTPAKYKGEDINGVSRWTGNEVTFEER